MRSIYYKPYITNLVKYITKNKIVFKRLVNATYKISIFKINGELIREISILTETNVIDISNLSLSHGIFLLKIETKNNTDFQKIQIY